jgi:uncharacterized protein YeeX (DUF496 family)
MTIEMICKINIIKLPKSATYSLQDILTVLLYATTSTSNSSESASNNLKLRNPDKKIPLSDTINNYIKSNNIEYILSSFRKITQDVVIDFHDIPYYGDKNTSGVRGIKAKNGTS